MKQTPWLGFTINRSGAGPVFEQICAAIRERVAQGELAAGAKLPPTRVFATELGVSRSTVVTAYEQLVAEGYLEAQQGSGFTVCALGELELAPAARDSIPPEAPEPPPRPFESGQPDMREFPYRPWARVIARVCRTNPQAMLVGAGPLGNGDLRRAIADHVAEWRGIEASPHQIIVTAGSSDALELCMRVLAQTGDRIGLEDPGYAPMRAYAMAQGLEPVFMPIDEGGATLPPDGDLGLAVLTPSHQFPLGGVMSPQRRLEFIRWAEARDGWIVEDDYDSEFRYAGRPIPAMAGFDRLNRTIYVGSFSKIFSNTLRLGYVIVPDALLERFRETVTRFGVKASLMPQQALAEFINNGEFYRHLRRVRRIYGERREVLLTALSGEFAEFGRVEDHQAGMQVAFHLNCGLRDVDISELTLSEGVDVAPLSRFGGRASGLNGLVLGFCAYRPEEMRPALATLHGVLKRSAG